MASVSRMALATVYTVASDMIESRRTSIRSRDLAGLNGYTERHINSDDLEGPSTGALELIDMIYGGDE